MADTVPNTLTPTPPAKAIVTRSASAYSPCAVHLPVKLRATAIQLLNELKPEGNPHPDRLRVAKQTAIALIEAQPAEVTGIEVKLEISGHAASQVMVIVFPHQL